MSRLSLYLLGPPRIECDGVTTETSYVETAGSSRRRMGDEWVTVEPWLLLLFPVPEQATQVTLAVQNHPPLSVSVPAEVSDELSSFDVR